MTHAVEVKQLRDRTGEAFLNVTCKQGSIGVQAHNYGRPTYIMILRNFVDLVQYADEAWAQEGLAEYAARDGDWKVITVAGLASFATASAAEVDAVRRAQEAEAELRELRRAVVTAVGPFAMLEVLDGDVLVNDGVYINARDVARVRLLYGKCKDAADAP